MQEADLRRHLAMQGLESVALVDIVALAGTDDEALEAAIDAALAGKPDTVLFDVVDSAHLARIGGVLWRRAQRDPRPWRSERAAWRRR